MDKEKEKQYTNNDLKIKRLKDLVCIQVDVFNDLDYFNNGELVDDEWIQEIGFFYDIYYKNVKIASGVDTIDIAAKDFEYDEKFISKLKCNMKNSIKNNLAYYLNKPYLCQFGSIMQDGIKCQVMSDNQCLYIESDEIVDSYDDHDIKKFNEEIELNNLNDRIECWIDSIEEIEKSNNHIDYVIVFYGASQCYFNLLTREEYSEREKLLK